MKKTIILLLQLLLTFCFAANAQYHEYIESAKRGYHGAQFNVGLAYYEGDGVKQDYKKAIQWWKKAAAQGNEDAMYNIGFCYEKGFGVKQDIKQAFEWYRKSATSGRNELAWCALGECYEEGKGTVSDNEQAEYWYRKAASYNIRAQHLLGKLYYKHGFYEDAAIWLNRFLEEAEDFLAEEPEIYNEVVSIQREIENKK